MSTSKTGKISCNEDKNIKKNKAVLWWNDFEVGGVGDAHKNKNYKL